jgi:predicted nucleic acid-binding protein
MKRLRVYADTSVFGGVFDDEFRVPSEEFFEEIRKGRFALVTSAVVQAEIDPAPDQVKQLFDETLAVAELIDVTEEALRLRDAYLGAKIISAKYSDDALHVALATVSECSLIVSWNFRHIVHFEKIPMYNAVSTLHGYKEIDIFSPLEVIYYEED